MLILDDTSSVAVANVVQRLMRFIYDFQKYSTTRPPLRHNALLRNALSGGR